MKKNIHHLKYGGKMYLILVYDILLDDEDGAKVSRKVFKTCKRYLYHIQKSVFEGELSDVQYLKLQSELFEILRKDKDSCIVFKSRNEKWLTKEFLAKNEIDKTSNLI